MYQEAAERAEAEGYADVGRWAPAVAPGRRRRMLFDRRDTLALERLEAGAQGRGLIDSGGPPSADFRPAFDEARHLCNMIADYVRHHGPFEPHRLPMDEMEYTTLPQVMERLEGRWEGL